MRKRLGISALTLAAGASLLVHALLFATFSTVQFGVGPPPQLAEMSVFFEEPAEEPADDFAIGKPDATGYATHAVDGRREQAAREAMQDQPSLSLDPAGDSAAVEVPSEPEGQTASPAPPPAPRAAASISAEETLARARGALESLLERLPRVEPDEAAPPPLEVMTPTATEVHLAPPAEITPPPASPFAPASPVAPIPQHAQRAGGTGADPAPQGDSEVDPFSVLGSAQYRNGKVTVQSGRQVKTRRPKIRLAGMIDLAERATARVVLKVAVDATGKVTDVAVAKSSGSNEIDQPCRVAMYEWWFEPKKDPDGRPVPDVFQFAINFQ
jgi:TonB family protein